MTILFYVLLGYLVIGMVFSLVILPYSRRRVIESDNTTPALRESAARIGTGTMIVLGMLWPSQVVSMVLALRGARRMRREVIVIPCPGCGANLDTSDGTHCTALDEGIDDAYLFRCGPCGVRSAWDLQRPALDAGVTWGRYPPVTPSLIQRFDDDEEIDAPQDEDAGDDHEAQAPG